MGKLFGTDGIRGRAGEFPLDAATARVIGTSLARQFAAKHSRPARFITGRDTRESGSWIEAALHSGARSAGAEISSAGVITTPGVAYLTAAEGMDAGFVISASHNPFEDNGIKIFLPSGQKIEEAAELAIERDIASAGASDESFDQPVDTSRADGYARDYFEHLVAAADGASFSGLRIVIDCANGAACGFAGRLFERLSAEVIPIHDKPDGRNINLNCGSLHLGDLQRKVVEHNADLGIAFDGDADRSLFVDAAGEIVDGDATMWVMAKYLQDHGGLANSTVVATVMSNIGLELALRSRNVRLLRANVGDKYVLDSLLQTGSEIGGEQSGHIIFPRRSLVGDGMMTALLLTKSLVERGETLGEAVNGFVRYPQILVNVKVAEKRPFDEVPAIAKASAELARQLDGNGRLLLRYSGTENLARVMIEGEDQGQVEQQANALADIIRTSLGG